MPNVEHRDRKQLKITWEPLFEEIRKELPGSLLVHAGVYNKHYVSETKQAKFIEHIGRKFNRQGFEFHVRDAKDIDSWIINDIWMSVARTQELTVREKEVLVYPLRMKHVLVSGDGGYLRAYDSLNNVYGDDLEIELIVYAWRSDLSGMFYNIPAQIRYLDDIPNLAIEH